MPDLRGPLSRRLAQVSELIDIRLHAKALAEVNRHLPSASTPGQSARWLAQVARSLAARGRFQDSAKALSRVIELSRTEPRAWLQPHISRLRMLLKNCDLQAAETAASTCLAEARQREETFNSLRRQANDNFRRTGRVVVPVRPHRSCVVACELGHAFLLEGEIEPARRYFLEAIRNNPRGGTRARQGLAEIALREGDATTAFRRAAEAITLGKFQAKTIASWKLLIAAKRLLGNTSIPAELLAGLAVSPPGVRARTTLLIVRELRASRDPQWQNLANRWLSRHASDSPAIAAELRKLIVAEARLTSPSPHERLRTARQLLATPRLAPHEWLAAAKQIVNASLQAKQNLDILSLVAQGSALFGPDFAITLRHSLALSCMEAKRHDLGRSLLEQAISLAPQGSDAWSKALWALARMEAHLGRHQLASSLYLRLAADQRVPERFRLQARLLSARSLLASGSHEPLEHLANELPGLINNITDFQLLLDFARQLSVASPQLRPLAADAFQRAKTLALHQFHEAQHPSLALDVLFKLLRRMVWDFVEFEEALALWDALPEQKKLWLWSNDTRWWRILAFIVTANLGTARLDEAFRIAQEAVDDPAVPREALPPILIPCLEENLRAGQVTAALEEFRTITAETPTAPGAAKAWLWLALDAHRRGQTTEVNRLCHALLAANQHTEIASEQWLLEAQARLLLADLDPSRLPPQTSHLTQPWLDKAAATIRSDLKTLGQP